MEALALYSLHDVTPAHGDTVLRALDHLRDLGAERLTLLVVPNFHGQAPLQRAPAFVRALRERLRPGDEIALHGFLHRADRRPAAGLAAWKARHLTANEGEFAALTHAEALERIVDGLEVLQDCLEQPVHGFVAPAWLDNPDVRRAVADAGLRWCEDHVWLRDVRALHRQLAPAVSLASRTPLRAAASLAQAYAAVPLLDAAPLVRLAVHPLDYRLPRLVGAIEHVAGHWTQQRRAVTPLEVVTGWLGMQPDVAQVPEAQPGNTRVGDA